MYNVIIADDTLVRARSVSRLLENRYDIIPEIVASWDQLKERALEILNQNDRLDMVIMVEKLTGVANIYNRAVALKDFVVEGYVVALTESSTSPAGNYTSGVFFVPQVDGRLDKVGLFGLLDHTLTDPVPLPDLEITDESDLVLDQQIRSLDRRYRREGGRNRLKRIVRRFRRDCRTVCICRLTQGHSGSLVFRMDFGKKETKESPDRYVVKVTRSSDLWKIRRGSANWEDIHSVLQKGELLSHAPRLIKPDNSAEPGSPWVRDGDFLAEAWSLLGGELGAFMDFEEAYLRSGERPEELVAKRLFASEEELLPEAFLRQALACLDDCWYQHAKARDIRALWTAEDAPFPGVSVAPPYQLTSWWKAEISGSLESLATPGSRLYPRGYSWVDDKEVIERWINSGPEQSVIDASRGRAVLSPVHGDLNRNNVLMWVEEAQPFFIDFTTYQQGAHTMQDFACLEIQIKIWLMDREINSPHPALDLTPDRFARWCEAEKEITAPGGLSSTVWGVDRGDRTVGVGLALSLISLVRSEAMCTHLRAFGCEDLHRFEAEYAAALLFHTLRAIAYRDLSPFKRLLAVFSSARLIVAMQLT